MIKLLNATLIDIEVETELTSSGCPTCDYGREYTSYIYLKYENALSRFIPFEDQNTISLMTIIKTFSDFKKFEEMTVLQFEDYLHKELKIISENS